MSDRISIALLVAFVAAPAFAQTAAPAPQGQALSGSLVPGVCLLSQQTVLADAKVGRAATVRLRELAAQAQAEVDGERKPIAADAQALQGQQATLKPAERQQKQQALAQRLQAVEQKAQQRSREIELTREKAVARIATEAQPVIAQVYKAHNCGLLLDRNSILGGNMGGDLTAEVIKGLDAKITTISFNRETLPPQGVNASPPPTARGG